MNKERELLERCLRRFYKSGYECSKLVEDIENYLANANPSEAEPVAYLYDLDAYCDHRPEQDVLARKIPKSIPSEYLKNVRPLFLHPAQRPEFVRLNIEEASALMVRDCDRYELICAVENRLVEKNK